MANKNLDESKKVAQAALKGNYISPSDVEREKVEQFQNQRNKVEIEDELIRQKYNMDYDSKNPISFEEYKKFFLIKKDK